MTTPPLRAAARVIALDDHDQVLLLRYEENGGFWATPGGANDGQDDGTALRRELGEELGVKGTAVALRGLVAERSTDHPVGDIVVRQVERYHLIRLTDTDIDPTRATQPDTIRGHRWWTLAELRSTSETVYPMGLADLIATVAAAGVPEHPVVLH